MTDEPEIVPDVPDDDDDEFAGVWVSSDLNPDGTASYIVTVAAGPDVALSLEADAAMRYCATVTRAAVIAEHDAAVFRQMTKRLGLSRKTAGATIKDLRDDREPLSYNATAPLHFEPILSGSTFKPYVHVSTHGVPYTQWSPQDCYQHVGHVMQVLAGVDLDAGYLQYLIRTIGIGETRAQAAVHDLADQRAQLADQ